MISLKDIEPFTPRTINFTLERDGLGLVCKFPALCSVDDFYQAVITIQKHPHFSQITYCIFDMAVVQAFARGQANLDMILAHLSGSRQTNPRLKIAFVSNDPDALTFAKWLATHSNRAIGHFRMMTIARTWTDMSPWIKANLDL